MKEILHKKAEILTSYKNYLLENGFNTDQVNGIPDNQFSVEECFIFFKNQIGRNNGNLITPAPLEVHPYLEKYPVDPSRKKLIIGTFPPISYIGDYIDYEGYFVGNMRIPQIPFFYGDQLSFWEFCADEELLIAINRFRAPGFDKFKMRDAIVNYLERNSISVSDIITSCQRELVDGKYTEKNNRLWNIKLNTSLIDTILEDNEITELIFTSSVANGGTGLKIKYHDEDDKNKVNSKGLVDIVKKDALSLFLRACQIKEIKIELAFPLKKNDRKEQSWISINYKNREDIAHFKNIIFFHMRLHKDTKRYNEFIIYNLPNISPDTRSGTKRNMIYRWVTNWRDEWVRSPKMKISVDEYIKFVYDAILNGDKNNFLQKL
jgi:hypothetical protein